MIFEEKYFNRYILFYCLVSFTLRDIGQYVLLQLLFNQVVYQFLIKIKIFPEASPSKFLNILRMKRAFKIK